MTGAGTGALDYSAWGTAVSTDFDNNGIVDIIMHGNKAETAGENHAESRSQRSIGG